MLILICTKCGTIQDWPHHRFWAAHESCCCGVIMHRVEWDSIREIAQAPREERVSLYAQMRGTVAEGATVRNTELGNWWFMNSQIPVGATGKLYLATIPETGYRMWAVRYDRYAPKRGDVFYGLIEKQGDTLPFWLEAF